MVHLTNNKTILLMVFFSLLTYIWGPMITRPFLSDHPDQCVAGYLLGVTISSFIWMKWGRHLAN